jgi:hypothetical protein
MPPKTPKAQRWNSAGPAGKLLVSLLQSGQAKTGESFPDDENIPAEYIDSIQAQYEVFDGFSDRNFRQNYRRLAAECITEKGQSNARRPCE